MNEDIWILVINIGDMNIYEQNHLKFEYLWKNVESLG